MTIDLSDYEEISESEYEEVSRDCGVFYNEEGERAHYFRKKQPKQEFPIKIKLSDGNVFYIRENGTIDFHPIHYIDYSVLEQFEEAIKKAKKVRDEQ